ncbi:gram-negative bacteria-binding protein 3 isoform X1 [Drosophila elegans]|uniref:gram-negative bacteria-binding protein 3 isoform X1 n=1 Tax=Drosophila elegans TaxID=30023 RepID=UPI0007E703B8|nr:gram-negative bacteria-binding protein 3 isoform X1 [Drosophila elegans]
MSGYQVPVARIARPEKIGFEVSIPDEKGISLFAFHGRLNTPIVDLQDQTWAADIIRTDQKGRWTYTNRDAKLKKGDVLYYWTTVRYNGVDYHRMRQSADL